MRNTILYFALKYNGNFEKIYNALRNKEPVDTELFEKLKSKLSCNYVTLIDDNYPKELKHIKCPPFVLFFNGDLNLLKLKSITILGSQFHTTDSIKATHQLLSGIANKGYIIMSDHLTSLSQCIYKTADEHGARSVLFVPNIEFCNSNINYALQIADLVVSECPFKSDSRYEMVMMYRILIGLSKNTIISEYDIDNDINIILAIKYSIDNDKSIYCVPRNIDSKNQGTNRLIQNGAKMILSPDDIC